MLKENIYCRKDGRWEGRIPEGRKANGKRKYRSIYGKSYTEVQEKMHLLRENAMVCFEKTDLTVREVFDEWLYAISSRIKESTISNYRMKAEKHLLPAFGDMRCDSMTVRHVQRFMEEKRKSGLSARYVSDIIILLKSVFKYASQEYHVYNPIANVTLPKKKHPEIALLSKEQQRTLEKKLHEQSDLTSLGIALSMYTGIRIGELCALQWSDIDLEKRTLTVRKTIQRIQCHSGASKTKLIITEPKSSSSMRTIPIPKCLIPLLEQVKGTASSYILSNTKKPVEPRTMQYRFAAILKNAKLPSVHFHALRHMFATNCIALGFDVKSLSEILGHSSVEITLNRYVHSSMEQKKAFMERLTFVA